MIEVLCQSVKIKIKAYSEKDEVVKAEILKVVACDYFFRSVNKDSLIYKEMFPDLKIAASFSQEETKVKYNIQYGSVPYIKESLIKNLCNCPFTFKFDETTTTQVEKTIRWVCSVFLKTWPNHNSILWFFVHRPL